MVCANIEQERERFEAFASDDGKWMKAIERDEYGNYRLLTTNAGWLWWQAATAALLSEQQRKGEHEMSTAQKSEALDLAANHAQEDAPVGFAWSGWACMYPGKLPRLYGALEIASVNLDAANGDQLIHLSTSPDPKAQSRLAAYDHDARQREMQLLEEIEALESLTLDVLKQLKQLGVDAMPSAPLLRQILRN